MKNLKTISVALALLILISGCAKEETSTVSSQTSAVNVTVFEAKKGLIEDNVTYAGEIKASESTSISAKVSGQAETINCEIGDYVEAGDILLVMDDTDYSIQYAQALAAYEAAAAQYKSMKNGGAQQTKMQLEAALNAAKIEYNNAKTNYENQKILFENGAISKIALDTAEARYENAKINLDTAQGNYDITVNVVLEGNEAAALANMNSASAMLSAAQNALNNTVVRAPISGYIASRNANKGQLVSPGVEIFSIKGTNVVEAQINVSENIISNINEEAKAVVSVKSANKEIEGTVSKLSATKNQQTGLYSVSILIENEDSAIKDGMFADVKLLLNESQEAIMIPSEAVFEEENSEKYVYVANENTAEKVKVEVGIITEEFTEIISGISEGDKVVVSGKEYLSEKNNKIKIVQ